MQKYLTLVFPAAAIIAVLLFYSYYIKASRPKKGTAEWITFRDNDRLSLSGRRFKLDKGDVLPMILVTAIGAAVSFFMLGSLEAPQSFYRFENAGDSVTVSLSEETPLGEIMYYTGLTHGKYMLELSPDGETWEEQIPAEGTDEKDGAMAQPHSHLFKWRIANLTTESPVRFIRITALTGGMELGELSLRTADGEQITTALCEAAPELLDEQGIIPESPSWYNGMIFDEIYHGRTAFEHLRGEKPYETTHPPLGKLIIAIGVSLFGMVPFGWRFMGTLFGVLMLPLFYIMLKWMFGKRAAATCGTLVFAFDFMRYTQTRLATIDTYSVFFTVLMFMFMYRFITWDYDAPLKKSMPSLFLSGLFFGLGAASKWTAMYAGAGLAVVYLLHHILVWRHYSMARRGKVFAKRLLATVALSVVFFVVIPAVIYCLSYFANGVGAGLDPKKMLFGADYYKMIWNNQLSMFSYHSGLTATHPYQSTWYQWVLDIRPILYYRSYSAGNTMKSVIAAFGNPLVWWGGLVAMLAMIYRIFARRDGKAAFIVIGYLAALLPWVIITRCAFIYHYFTCAMFLCVAIAHVFDTMLQRDIGHAKAAVYVSVGCVILLFAAFFPVLSGLEVPSWYMAKFLRWLPETWPL